MSRSTDPKCASVWSLTVQSLPEVQMKYASNTSKHEQVARKWVKVLVYNNCGVIECVSQECVHVT